MKYIKKFRLFESNWSFEEYVSYLTQMLSKMELTPEMLRHILDQKEEDIKEAIDSGVHPQVFVKDLIDEMGLEISNGFLGYLYPKSGRYPLKYL